MILPIFYCMKYVKKTIVAIALMMISLVTVTGCDTPSYVEGGVHYVNPPWAPAYYPGIRYYYLPDIEVYYDLSAQQFVYFDNGQWLFSPTLPSFYAGYDLFNGFVVALNLRVFQPWMHHQVYVSHYPRNYYHNFFHGPDISHLRGFNENDRKHFLWRHDDRDRKDDHDRRNDWRDNQRNNKPDRRPGITRPPRDMDANQRNLGQPVKVTPPMRQYNPTIKRPQRR